jgi:hypothetical protein
MPYLREVKTKRLTLPSNPDYWVDMRDRLSYGAKGAAQNAMVKISNVEAARLGKKRDQAIVDRASGRAVLTEFETDAYFATIIAGLIADWNLDGEDGVLPITPESVAQLDGEDGDFLQAEAQKRIGGRPRDQLDPSATPSSPSSRQEADSPKITRLPAS